MSDLEFDADSDQEVSENHSKFIDAIRQLDKGQRVRKPERSEPSLEVSEFHLVKSGIADQDAVEIDDLAKTLGKKGQHADLSKKINATKARSKVLPKPLERPAAERIKRTVGFENVKKDLGKWSGIIARNRTAASVSFPLSQASMKLEATDEYVKRFRLQSDLEKKLAELEPQKEEEPEEKDEFPLTLEEILERRREAAKLRAQQSYKVAKARRQNKIKSKKFHRIQRKERIKKTLKEFEELQKTDPEAALEKLGQLDRTRAEERMTLRHKSTGQWAKSKQIRAKYDKDSRQVLAEQLAISRELTQKVKLVDSEDDDDELVEPIRLSNADKENPWMNNAKSENEIDDFISGYRKFWDSQNKSKKQNESTDKDEADETPAKKMFEELEIKEIPRSQNPVEGVTEEYLPAQNGFDQEDDSDKQENTNGISNKKLKKKLKKSSKDKLGIKSSKSKITKVKKSKDKVGTSSWSVSPVNTTSNITNSSKIKVDEISDTVEETIQEKIKKKLAKVKAELGRETKREKRKNKIRKKDDAEDDVEKLGLKGQKIVRPTMDTPNEESASSKPTNNNSEFDKITNLTDFNTAVSKPKSTDIDPNKFMNMKPKHLKTQLPDEIGGEDALDDSEGEEDQHQIISEAFADDDVVDEFRKEKEDEIKKSQPEDVNLHLPGWGSWGGKNIQPSNRKKRRFILKFPKEAPRRDENKGDVVIIEEKCPKIKKHLVSDLPFPFTSVQDYEASLRAPVGRDFVPEKTFGKLIQPAVKTKMGKVIEPMSEDALVKMNSNLKKRKKPVKASTEDGQKSKKKKGNERKALGVKSAKKGDKKTVANGVK